MLRTTLLVTLISLWLIHVTVMTACAQEPASANSSEPTPAKVWHPKRFPPLYPQPRAAAPQTKDVERAPAHEQEEQERPSHTGLLIGGVLMFASSYLVTAVAYAAVDAINQSDCEAGDTWLCNKDQIMLVPVVGPFLSTQGTAVALMLSGPQIVGLVLTVAGIYQASRPVRRTERASFDVYAVPLPSGCILNATLRL